MLKVLSLAGGLLNVLLRSTVVDGLDRAENLGATGFVRGFLEVVGLETLSIIAG